MKKTTSFIIILMTSLILLQGCTLPWKKDNDVKTERKTIYRVIQEEDGSYSRITNYEDQMYKYPDGVDFDTAEEAEEYRFQKGGGMRGHN